MKEPDILAGLAPIYAGFREDYFLAWLEGYGLFCIPNFVARMQKDKLVLHLLEHVTESDLAEIRLRLGQASYRIARDRLTLEQIEAATGFTIPG